VGINQLFYPAREFNQDTSRAKKAAREVLSSSPIEGGLRMFLLTIEQYQENYGQAAEHGRSSRHAGGGGDEFEPPRMGDDLYFSADFS